MSLLVTGDSAAAGVGAEHQDQALLGNLLARLAARRRVSWKLLARTGARTGDVVEALEALDVDDVGPFEVAVVSVGLNDVIAGARLTTWRARHAELREVLRRRLGVRRMIVCGLPPVGRFPALPQPLRWYLGRGATRFDRALRRDVQRERGASFLGLDFATDVTLIASDGFHPGPKAYAAWAERLAPLLLTA